MVHLRSESVGEQSLCASNQRAGALTGERQRMMPKTNSRRINDMPASVTEEMFGSLPQALQDKTIHIERILLEMVCAEGDLAIPVGQLMAKAFERAGEPKRMMTLQCNHTDVFVDGAAFTQAANASVAWFQQYLAH